MALEPLECKGRDQHMRVFYVEVESPAPEDPDHWQIRVHRQNPPDHAADNFVDLTVRRFDDTSVVITVIKNYQKKWYAQKGIPDAVIPYVATTLDKDVLSSSNQHKRWPDEYRNANADKYWNRLVRSGKANYDAGSDRFRHSCDTQC